MDFVLRDYLPESVAGEIHGIDGLQYLLRARSDQIVPAEVGPANPPARIEKKFSRACNISASSSRVWMYEVPLADYLRFFI